IQQTVVIVVEPTGRNGPGFSARSLLPQPRALRNVFKLAVSTIPIEDIPVDAYDEQIGGAIVIIVGCRNAHPKTFAANSGHGSHVGECAVAIVLIEAIVIA